MHVPQIFFNKPTVLSYYRLVPRAACGRCVLAIAWYGLRFVPPSHWRSAQMC